MKRNSKLSVSLHALIHVALHRAGPITSEELAGCLETHPVVVRRTLGELRVNGLVTAVKGHGGGWSLAKAPHEITLLDVYLAIGESFLPKVNAPDATEKCIVVQCMATTMGEFVEDARSLLESRLRRVTLQSFLDRVDETLSVNAVRQQT